MALTCPACGGRIPASEVAPGGRVKCPSCHKSFRARGTGAAPASSPKLGQQAVSEIEKTCPFCGESIKQAAIKCKHCRSDLTNTPRVVSQQENPLYDSDTREVIIFEGTPSQWTNCGKFVFCAVFALISLVLFGARDMPIGIPLGMLAFAALLALACYVEVRFTIYKVTTERIEVEKGWISKRLNNLDLFRVKDIRLAIGVFDRLIGLGNVIIVSRDSTDPVLRLNGIHHSRSLYDQLKKEAIRADRRRGVVHIES